MPGKFHNTIISLFHKPRYEPTNKDRDIALSLFVAHVRDGVWREQIDALRATTDSAAFTRAKDNLPGVTPQGTFSSADTAGFLEPAGLVHFDIDAKDNPGLDPVALRGKLA